MNNQDQTLATIAEEKIAEIIYSKKDRVNRNHQNNDTFNEINFVIQSLWNLTSTESNGDEITGLEHFNKAKELFSPDHMSKGEIEQMITDHRDISIKVIEIKVLDSIAQVEVLIKPTDQDAVMAYYYLLFDRDWKFIQPVIHKKDGDDTLQRLYALDQAKYIVDEAFCGFD